MNKTIILSDSHQDTDWIDRVIEKEKDADHFVLAGDFFDTRNWHYDNNHYVEKMASNLIQWINNPKFTVLMGNHDAAYCVFRNIFTECSGFCTFKFHLINAILKPEHWKKFKFHVWVDNWLITHAGLSNTLIKTHKISKQNIKELLIVEEKQAIKELLNVKGHWMYVPGRARGGYAKCGGLNWCDWNREFEPVPWLKQIMGHTAGDTPRNMGDNWCIDTKQRHYGVLIDGKFEVRVVEKP